MCEFFDKACGIDRSIIMMAYFEDGEYKLVQTTMHMPRNDIPQVMDAMKKLVYSSNNVK